MRYALLGGLGDFLGLNTGITGVASPPGPVSIRSGSNLSTSWITMISSTASTFFTFVGLSLVIKGTSGFSMPSTSSTLANNFFVGDFELRPLTGDFDGLLDGLLDWLVWVLGWSEVWSSGMSVLLPFSSVLSILSRMGAISSSLTGVSSSDAGKSENGKFRYYEPRYEKTCLRGFRPGKTQTGLLSFRD